MRVMMTGSVQVYSGIAAGIGEVFTNPTQAAQTGQELWRQELGCVLELLENVSRPIPSPPIE
jgi:hypothetical protein